MISFSANDSYARFASAVRSTSRYVRDPQSEEFLSALLSQAESKVEPLAKGYTLWRAQLGYEMDVIEEEGDEGPYSYEVPVGYSSSRMKPLPDRAREGRANPKGIPVVYLATRQETAMAEVRPWVGTEISLGQFATQRALRVVNCTEHEPFRWNWGCETPQEYWDDNNWCDIDAAFSKPVTLADDTADYVPTQVIAELFKVNGFDGVAYASSVGDGHNIALFNLDDVELTACCAFSLKSMTFEFNEEWNPYFVKPAEEPSSG